VTQEAQVVRLAPMTPDQFAAFLERDTREYADEMVKAGFWSRASALRRSQQEHRRLLRDGLHTRGHQFFTIEDAQTGQAVGVIWLNVRLESAEPLGYIYAIEVDEAFRRKGYAREAMLELETAARGQGLKQLGLHVFAHNEAARALYEKLGYRLASLNLQKEL
jgi:RimJ/RimL family protein N-acetyltransferase